MRQALRMLGGYLVLHLLFFLYINFRHSTPYSRYSNSYSRYSTSYSRHATPYSRYSTSYSKYSSPYNTTVIDAAPHNSTRVTSRATGDVPVTAKSSNSSEEELDDLHKFLSLPLVNNFSSSYIYNRQNVCGLATPGVGLPVHRDVHLLFVIPSAPGNARRRDKVRASGLYSYAKNPANKAAVLFFIGAPDPLKNSSASIQLGIDSEVRLHQDIVQLEFTDVYKNILVKAVSMLRWAAEFCSSAKYVIRTDDDVRINVTKLVKAVQEVGGQKDNFILAGYLAVNYWVFRDKNSKYFISKKEYPHAKWPPFALGGLIGYPLKTVRLLYEATLRVKRVWLDDVFVTGICAKKVGAVLVQHDLFKFKHGW